jgi:hypothetical protein
MHHGHIGSADGEEKAAMNFAIRARVTRPAGREAGALRAGVFGNAHERIVPKRPVERCVVDVCHNGTQRRELLENAFHNEHPEGQSGPMRQLTIWRRHATICLLPRATPEAHRYSANRLAQIVQANNSSVYLQFELDKNADQVAQGIVPVERVRSSIYVGMLCTRAIRWLIGDDIGLGEDWRTALPQTARGRNSFCALCLRRDKFNAQLGRLASREREGVSTSLFEIRCFEN